MPQSTSFILMIRPAAFGFDPLSAATNAFQEPALHNPHAKALAEFDRAVKQLRQAGVDVLVATDTPAPPKPDAVFPNNWLSTWPDGRIFLYPMCVPTRRLERRQHVLKQLKHHFIVTAITDLSGSENTGRFLESTGAMVFDHPNKLVYANVSARCNPQLLRNHARQIGYTPIVMHAVDDAGTPIYHTNVMLGVQSTTAIICADILPTNERKTVLAKLQSTKQGVVTITAAQVRQFAGNVLEVKGKDGKLLVLSKNAFDSLHPRQRSILAADKALLPISIPTIEMVGGGGIRCMMAEIFLPPKASTA